MTRFTVRAATSVGAVLLLAACSGGSDIAPTVAPTVTPTVTPTVAPTDDTVSPTVAPTDDTVSPTATPNPSKKPTEYASPKELPFEGNTEGDVAIIKDRVFVWNAATSSWEPRGKIDDSKKPDNEGVVVGKPLVVPSKVKTFATKLNVQTVIAPDFKKVPEFANAPWSVSVSPVNAAALEDASPDPTKSAIALPSFVPTGTESKFTVTIKSSKKTYIYTVTVE